MFYVPRQSGAENTAPVVYLHKGALKISSFPSGIVRAKNRDRRTADRIRDAQRIKRLHAANPI